MDRRSFIGKAPFAAALAFLPFRSEKNVIINGGDLENPINIYPSGDSQVVFKQNTIAGNGTAPCIQIVEPNLRKKLKNQ
jgi:hypothetical protein